MEQNRQKKLQFGDFHVEHPECMFQRQRFLRKFPNISGFYLGLSPFSLGLQRPANISFLILLEILR